MEPFCLRIFLGRGLEDRVSAQPLFPPLSDPGPADPGGCLATCPMGGVIESQITTLFCKDVE